MMEKPLYIVKALAVVLLVAAVFATPAMFADESSDGEFQELEAAVAKANKKCIQLEHDAVYNDPECKVAYQAVKKAEKELLRKRQILSDKLEKNSEIQRARMERKRAYDRLKAFEKRTGLRQRKEKK